MKKRKFTVKSEVVEVLNRYEISLVLTKLGGLVFEPDADVDGVDFAVKSPEGKFFSCQLKSRCTVEKKRYGGRDIWMVFPGAGEPMKRDWYFIEHDLLFKHLKKKHGKAPKWNHETRGEYWVTNVTRELEQELRTRRVYRHVSE